MFLSLLFFLKSACLCFKHKCALRRNNLVTGTVASKTLLCGFSGSLDSKTQHRQHPLHTTITRFLSAPQSSDSTCSLRSFLAFFLNPGCLTLIDN